MVVSLLTNLAGSLRGELPAELSHASSTFHQDRAESAVSSTSEVHLTLQDLLSACSCTTVLSHCEFGKRTLIPLRSLQGPSVVFLSYTRVLQLFVSSR